MLTGDPAEELAFRAFPATVVAKDGMERSERGRSQLRRRLPSYLASLPANPRSQISPAFNALSQATAHTLRERANLSLRGSGRIECGPGRSVCTTSNALD